MGRFCETRLATGWTWNPRPPRCILDVDFQVLRLDWVSAGCCQTMSSVAAIPVASFGTRQDHNSAGTGGSASAPATTPTGTLVVDVLITVRPLETKRERCACSHWLAYTPVKKKKNTKEKKETQPPKEEEKKNTFAFHSTAFLSRCHDGECKRSTFRYPLSRKTAAGVILFKRD